MVERSEEGAGVAVEGEIERDGGVGCKRWVARGGGGKEEGVGEKMGGRGEAEGGVEERSGALRNRTRTEEVLDGVRVVGVGGRVQASAEEAGVVARRAADRDGEAKRRPAALRGESIVENADVAENDVVRDKRGNGFPACE